MKVYRITVFETDSDGKYSGERYLSEVYAIPELAEAAARVAAAEAATEGWDDVKYEVEPVWINVGFGDMGCEAGDVNNELWERIQQNVTERLAVTK